MTPFPQAVAAAQQELQDAIQAGSRPSAFAQGVMPNAPAQPAPQPMPDPMQLAMMQQMAAQPAPQQPLMLAKGGLAVWDRPAPKGKSRPLSAKQKGAAKRRAKSAGRPYPNLVDNLAVKRK